MDKTLLEHKKRQKTNLQCSQNNKRMTPKSLHELVKSAQHVLKQHKIL
jgi:hypothetical protein